jgi:hypothetical protein
MPQEESRGGFRDLSEKEIGAVAGALRIVGPIAPPHHGPIHIFPRPPIRVPITPGDPVTAQ